MGIQNNTVKVLSISIVKPAEQKPPYVQFLSMYDHLFATTPYYLQGVYYFRADFSGSDAAKVIKLIDSLKQSLSKTLSHFPVVAGRVRWGKQGRLELLANGGGIPFIEAVADARLDDWPDLCDCSIEWDLNPKNAMIRDLGTIPLARVQFTVFKCGGIAIGYSSAHVLSDGLGAVDFMKAWGEIHRGLAISVQPFFDRSYLKARDPPRVTVPVPDYVSSLFVGLAPDTDYGHLSSSHSGEPLVTMVFKFSATMVNECVQQVEQGPYRYGTATSFEALSALIWTSITRARSLVDEIESKYFLPYSIRGRWEPPLPREFFGNAAALLAVKAKAGDIKSKHISYTARLIHSSIQEVSIESLKSQIDWMEMAMQRGIPLRYSDDPDRETDIDNTTFASFPVYTVNFGWGSPLFFAFSIPPHIGEGAAYILPSPDGGRKRIITICLRKEHMHKLIHNENFSRYLITK